MKRTITQRVVGERAVAGGRCATLAFRLDGGGEVPAILTLPDSAAAVPAAVLLHGYSSRKEHMAESVGRALLSHGIASLAIDLPMHGERADPSGRREAADPLALMRHWNEALADGALSLRYLAARREVDRDRLAVVGYSLGSFLGITLAAREPAVRAVVLAAGGDLPANTPFAFMVRRVVDPASAVRKLAGRPLLMVHGRSDRTVTPEQAERLFAAASEPKTLKWWDAGHYLPARAIDDAAAWLAERLGATGGRRHVG